MKTAAFLIEPLENRIAPAFAAVIELSALSGSDGFALSGVAADDRSGSSVSGAGDVNGDGFEDFLIGAFGADPNGSTSGASYLVFGKVGGFSANLNLSSLDGTNGFQLSGGATSDFSGFSVSGAGDVNGDGFDDLLIGAAEADPNGSSSGASYLIFGKAGGFSANLNLATLDGTNGFQLSGAAAGDRSGRSVSGAGDVNGDGFADILIGAPFADPNGADSGASYVIFGKASGGSANFDLATLDGTNGFQLSGAAANDRSGVSVSGAGDVNGDGFDDLLIGADGADPNASACGASYVIFGKAGGFSANLNLSTLNGTNGFRLSGVAANDASGRSVSGAGDVNGDGFADLLIGAPYSGADNSCFGASYVVFGKARGFSANLNLSTLNGANGFKLGGVAAKEYSGRSVSGAGDVNGDGFADLLIGAPGADPNGPSSGASYVVFGKTGGFSANLDLATLNGTNGFKLNGVAGSDVSGRAVSGAGDVNGDGAVDLLIGAENAGPNGAFSGASYVVFGKGPPPTLSVGNASVAEGNSGSTTLNFTVSLSALSAFPVTVSYATADGTAAAGSDYIAMPPTLLTFAPGEISKTVSVTVNGDTLSEANETLSLMLSSPTGADLLKATGTGTIIYDDAALLTVAPNGHSATFDDLDGDRITILTSKGTLSAGSIVVTPVGNLLNIDLTGEALALNGANLTISAKTLTGGSGNGLVNVGFIDAGGLVLGNVKVSGALGAITIGNGDPTKLVLKSLTVGSLGLGGTEANPQVSEILGSLGSLIVKGDMRTAAVNVLGTVGKVTISGDLSGALSTPAGAFNPRVGGGVIAVGSFIAGGIGKFTVGSVHGGKIASDTSIASLTVGNAAAGGDFSNSSVTAAGTIKIVKVFGNLSSDNPLKPSVIAAGAEGSRVDSITVRGDMLHARITVAGSASSISAGSIHDGAIVVDGNLGRLTVGNATAGGDFSNGSLGVQGSITGVKVFGKLSSDNPLKPAVVSAGGPLGTFTVRGDILHVKITATGNAGTISAGSFRDSSLTAGGNLGRLSVGSALSGGDFSNGSAKAAGKIGAVKVFGSFLSDDPLNPAVLSAGSRLDTLSVGGDLANALVTVQTRLGALSVGRDLTGSKLLIGYDAQQTGTNPDASVGKVVIGRDWKASSLAAGVLDPTADGFGQNDTRIAEILATPKIFAAIASITIKGSASGSPADGDFFGITAEQLGKLTISGLVIALTSTDTVLDTDFHAVRFA